jgi:hypothetical protein
MANGIDDPAGWHAHSREVRAGCVRRALISGNAISQTAVWIEAPTEVGKLDNNVATALISSGGSVLVAITALVLSHRGFASIDARLASLDGRFASIDGRFASIERRLDMLQADMKDLKKRIAVLAIDVALVKDKIGS